jgi:hypothetical protein
MKRLVLPIAAAALAVGLSAAPSAHADEQSYLADLANDGFTGSSSVAVKMGYAVCTDRQHGVPRDTTVQAIYDNTSQSVSVRDANYIYDAAVIHLC